MTIGDLIPIILGFAVLVLAIAVCVVAWYLG